MKHCSKCVQVLDEALFSRNKRMKDGLNTWCKSCVYAYQRTSKAISVWSEYRKANPKKVAGWQAKWRAENPEARLNENFTRRANLKNNGTLLVKTNELQRLRSQVCSYCGNADNIQIDHIVPLARGGRHSIGNLTSACAKCNQSKGAKFITEWKKEQK